MAGMANALLSKGRDGGGVMVSDDRLKADFLEMRGSAHLLARIRSHFEPDEQEKAAIDALVRRSQAIEARATIRRQGARGSNVFVLLAGACYESFIDIEGRVQIFDLRFPGDVVGPGAPCQPGACYNLRTATPCIVASIERDRFDGMMPDRLRRLFDTWDLVEHYSMRDRLRMVGRARASERILHLVMALRARQAHGNLEAQGRVWFPFSQSEVGDALGLTNVYVSKTLGSLKATGRLRIERDIARLRDVSSVAEEIDFEDRWSAIAGPDFGRR